MLMRSQFKNKTIKLVRNKSTGCLEWPLPEGKRFSNNLHNVESHWKDRIHYPSTSNENVQSKYILPMFPYPSGKLHMGHMRVYSISDVLNRYYRLNGFHVIHPIGWDAFGLPAENAAIERNVDPSEWTKSNIADMREQLLRLGFIFDWEREICTCNPDYYKWTQWIFLKLYENGLVNRVMSEVNWDPVDQTVLAAEQIDSEGRSWRSGAIAEKKKLKQWVIETPKYAKKLFDGLYDLRYDWKDVADIQMNWIGKCEVYRYKLPLLDENGNKLEEFLDLRVPNPVDLLNANFLILEPDHPFIPIERRNPSEPFAIESSSSWNFITERPLPLVVLPKNLFDQDVLCGQYYMKSRIGSLHNQWDKEILERLNLRVVEVPKKEMSLLDINELAMTRGYGGYLTSSHLADWVVSRQRAWGTPIPMVISKDGRNAVPIPEKQLPVLSELRGKEIVDERLSDGIGTVETDTLDTFFDSSWYYLRYLDSKNSQSLVERKLAEKHMPVDVYVGGVEHAAVHMFFARFVSHFLHETGVTSCAEPFHRLIPQGIVRAKTYVNPKTGGYVKPENVEDKKGNLFFDKETGDELVAIYEKMSKSKFNGVDPFEVVDADGIDLTRLLLLNSAAPRTVIDWGDDHNRIRGLKNFLDRVAWAINAYVENRRKFGAKFEPASEKVETNYKETYNFFVRAVSTFIEVLHTHNTAIARLIGMTNDLRKMDPLDAGRSKEIERCLHALVIMLQVFVPNTAAEFWSALCSVSAIQPELWNHDTELAHQNWPKIDANADIEFVISAYQISCSRLPVNRQTLESLSDAELMNLAKNHLHRPFFECFENASLTTSDFRVHRKSGFHVMIELILDKHITEKDINDVLHTLYKQRRGKKGDKRSQIPDEKSPENAG
uniref:leucine--tRNA ligase n=1 Tax=Acrobeloides nanus TaxID=290746 RepID=A0A914E218_9BILA